MRKGKSFSAPSSGVIRTILGCFAAMLLLAACGKRSGNPKVLVFSKNTYFFHSSIPNGIAAIQKLGAQNKFEVDTTTDAAYFTEDSLKKYAAVIFLNTADNGGNLLNPYQEAEFERYIQAGGGFVGIHAAADAEYGWGWYNRLVGGVFNGHPEGAPAATLNVVNKDNGATKGLPAQWKRADEWYNFKKLNKDVKVLLTIDESSYAGGTNGANHPMAWYHDYDGGRAFYTALGHTEESYTEPLFLNHLLGGIQYAIGDNKELDYDNAKTEKVPEEDRFVKTTLTEGTFFEPTEMAILPNFDVLVAQRRGEILRYSNDKKDVKQVGFLNVYFNVVGNLPGVNAEEGVLGITADPDFKNNNYVYIFYSPADSSVNRLSRFEFKNDTLDNRSEKVILQFYSQREICCHTGGSLAFGKDNMLFLSTGDNTTPFDEKGEPFANHGFAPLDDRPGHTQYDARRSAGNTADLRGKVLRIKINKDGSYSIPDGNLFPGNDPKARPEIYVMGNRNPYRISVDKKTGFLYWGEVGPDSSVDSLETRGPRGYDELNQARKAGFFGWPLFIGNNYPYRQHNYNTGVNGDAFNPAQPINASLNNTGLQQLPPAQSAFIWYPYAASTDFPNIGNGGRTAMAGPVYYTEDHPKGTRYPGYFNGKLFIYEWMRNWIKVVRMLPNGDYDKMDDFMQNTAFNSPVDMEVGPDGKIYVLEYGRGWFAKNTDAGLSRIDYLSGNRPPRVDSLVVQKESGNLPFTVNARVVAKDPENQKLSYTWTIGNNTVTTKEPVLQYEIKKGGTYPLSVSVSDEDKAEAKSREATVYAGNEMPQVAINLQGNRSFYFQGRPVPYNVTVTDNGQPVDMASLYVASDFVQGNEDLAAQGHQIVPETIMGKNIMQSSDCKSCHKVDEPSIGPAYTMVAKRYKDDKKAISYLTNKIIKGGAGAWGDVAMPAHTSMKEQDVKMIAKWVMSLAGDKGNKSLPASGQVQLQADEAKKNAMLTLTASYTDAGAAGVGPLSGVQTVFLRSNVFDASYFKTPKGFTINDAGGSKALVFPNGEASVKIAGIDLSGIKAIELIGFGGKIAGQYKVTVALDAPNGTVAGTGTIAFDAGGKQVVTSLPVQGSTDGRLHDVYFVFTPVGSPVKTEALLKTIRFVPQ